MESDQQHPILARAVIMEEIITKRGVLKRSRQIVDENQEHELEERQLGNYNSKANPKENLKASGNRKSCMENI